MTIWTEPMFFTPDRLMIAGIHRPTSTSSTVISLFWPLLMNTSTYSTQPTAIPALPAHAVIQYDHALKKPTTLPNAAREYAYGPPSAGSRRDSAANISASAIAPTVVSAIETSVIGPYPGQRGRQVEDPDPDDAAHDQRDRHRQAEAAPRGRASPVPGCLRDRGGGCRVRGTVSR